MMAGERAPWSDLSGQMYLPKSAVKLPGKEWKWNSEWKLQKETPEFFEDKRLKRNDHDGSYDDDGWQYAMDFQ